MREVRAIIRVIGPSIAYVPLTRGYYALIDSDDAERVGHWNWCAVLCSRNGRVYAKRKLGKNEGGRSEQISLQAYLLGINGSFVTADHVSLSGLDNRRANLRLATQSQQNANQRLRSDNRSGYKGVSLDKRWGRWGASISVRGQRKHLGYFDQPETAAAAYRAAAARYFGDFARAA